MLTPESSKVKEALLLFVLTLLALILKNNN